MKRYSQDVHGSPTCFIFGHSMDEDGNCCEHCGFPYYIIEDGWALCGEIAAARWRLHRQWCELRSWMWRRCEDPTCNKVEWVFGRRVGDHEKCSPMPF